jgi:DNA-binding MarR family transcriptional regulator
VHSTYFLINWFARPTRTLRGVSEGFVPGLRYRSGAQELWALVVESLAGWEARLNEAAARAGVSPVSAWALVQLDPEHPISQKELAALLHCNPSTVVDPTDRLEKVGLVVRQTNATDRRANVLVVTPKGKRVRDALIRRLFDPPEAFRGLSGAEQGRFREVMLAAVSAGRPPAAKPRAARKPPARSRPVRGRRTGASRRPR